MSNDNSPNLLIKVIKAASSQVKEVKYALAIAGIAAAAALIGIFFQGQFALAFIAVGILIIFMVILVIFQALPKLVGDDIKIPARTLAWFVLILFIATSTCFFSSVFFEKPRPLDQILQPILEIFVLEQNDIVDFKLYSQLQNYQIELLEISNGNGIDQNQNNQRIQDIAYIVANLVANKFPESAKEIELALQLDTVEELFGILQRELEQMLNEVETIQPPTPNTVVIVKEREQDKGILKLDIIIPLIIGVFLLFLCILLVILFHPPNPFQLFLIRTVLALASAGIATSIPGLIGVEINLPGVAVRALGALAIFILVYRVNPPDLKNSNNSNTSHPTLYLQLQKYRKELLITIRAKRKNHNQKDQRIEEIATMVALLADDKYPESAQTIRQALQLDTIKKLADTTRLELEKILKDFENIQTHTTPK